jgi:hypothetical protein
MKGLELWIDAARVERREDGHHYLKLEPSDFEQVPEAELAAMYDEADRTPDIEVPVTVKLRNASGKGVVLPEGEDLRMEWPTNTPMGTPASFYQDRLVLKRPGLHGIPMHAYQRDMATEDLMAPGGIDPHKGFAQSRTHSTPPELFGRGSDEGGRGTDWPRGSFDTTLPESLGVDTGKVRVDSRTLRPPSQATSAVQPTLSDQLLFAKNAHLPAIPRKVAEAITQAHRASRVFVFDRAASYRVGELCAYSPDLIADNQEFARCPYPRTFIQLDANALLDAMANAGLEVSRTHVSAPDETLGFLFTERGIYTAASHMTDAKQAQAGWTPFAYRPHQPMTQEQERRFMHEFGVPVVQVIDRFFWGSSYDTLGSPSHRRALRANNGLDVLLPEGWDGGRRAPLASLLSGGGAGDLKVALCAALLLIRPNLLVTKSEREAGRKLHLGKPTTFLAHRVVTIKLDADRTVRRIRQACKEERGRSKARWHEVRGHYCHNHRAKVAECAHDWSEVSPLKWECLRGCGGMRWWRECPNGRGDASIGVVTKH